MLNILLVEDEPLLASTVKDWIELNPRFQVTAIVDTLEAALDAIEERLPDLALVDLNLSDGLSGLDIAEELRAVDVDCLFTTGRPPTAPLPDLALGCLVKPYSQEDLVRALKKAEDVIRGREAIRPSLPGNLQVYEDAPAEEAPS